MVIKKYDELTEMHLDVLTEVGNIGSGNATTALSGLINKEVSIEKPTVRLVDVQEAVDMVGGPEKIMAAILVRLNKDIEGMILFLIEEHFASIISETFFGKKCDDLMRLDEGMASALTEIGNIMASSYVSAISTLANMDISVEAPAMTVDMLGAIMSVPAIEFGELGSKLMFIDKTIKIDGVNVPSKMLLLPTVQSLDTLMKKLGVE